MHLIQLHLPKPKNTLEYVQQIAALAQLGIDENYGLVCISPKRGLYVIRVHKNFDEEEIRALPEVKGVYGEVRISTNGQRKDDKED